MASTVGGGVFRPMTLVDVIGSLNQQSTTQQGADVLNGLAGFAEVDENATISGAMTATHSAPPGWDQTTWGASVWA